MLCVCTTCHRPACCGMLQYFCGPGILLPWVCLLRHLPMHARAYAGARHAAACRGPCGQRQPACGWRSVHEPAQRVTARAHAPGRGRPALLHAAPVHGARLCVCMVGMHVPVPWHVCCVAHGSVAWLCCASGARSTPRMSPPTLPFHSPSRSSWSTSGTTTGRVATHPRPPRSCRWVWRAGR